MKDKFLLIGLTGQAGVGKDTVAKGISETQYMAQYALAAPIKEALCTMFDLPYSVFVDRIQKEAIIPWIGKSPRYLAQKLGTEFGRDMVAQDIWLRVMQQHYEETKLVFEEQAHLHTVAEGFIVTDVRFDNEAEYIKNLGGVIWKIERKIETPVLAHVSEQGVSELLIDAVIDNNGELSLALEQADKLLDALRSEA